jgi:hypothetical protein
MNGGKISGNNVGNMNGGGGVFVEGRGTFIMDDGTITSNTAGNGGGVFVREGTFRKTGGTITGNTALIGDGGGHQVYAMGMMGDKYIDASPVPNGISAEWDDITFVHTFTPASGVWQE